MGTPGRQDATPGVWLMPRDQAPRIIIRSHESQRDCDCPPGSPASFLWSCLYWLTAFPVSAGITEPRTLLPTAGGAWTDGVLLTGAFPPEGSLGQRSWLDAGWSTDGFPGRDSVRSPHCCPCFSECPPESEPAREAGEAAYRGKQ